MHEDTQLVRQVVLLHLLAFSAPAFAGARSTPSTSSTASSPRAAPLRWLLRLDLSLDDDDLSHTYNLHNTRCSRCAGAVCATCLAARSAPPRAVACGVVADTNVGGKLVDAPIFEEARCARSLQRGGPSAAGQQVFQSFDKCSSCCHKSQGHHGVLHAARPRRSPVLPEIRA